MLKNIKRRKKKMQQDDTEGIIMEKRHNEKNVKDTKMNEQLSIMLEKLDENIKVATP